MPKQQEFKTKYTGVFYIIGRNPGTGKEEKIYYIRYKFNGKLIVEKAGRAIQDDMTPARANHIRAKRMNGEELSNKKRREEERKQKEAEASRQTLDKLWQAYLESHSNLKGLTTDKNRYELHLKPQFGDKEINQICALDIDRLRVNLLKEKSEKTTANTLELFRRIVNHGVNMNICEPLSFKIRMPKINNLKTEDLTPEHLQSLLDAIEEDTNITAKNMMLMALYTGMRRGEMFRLKWTDIDFDKGFIHIREPKGGVDQKIPLNDSARQILESHPRLSEFVFCGRNGGQRVDIRKAVNRIKQRAGLPADFRPLHGLRHVYASMLASSGQVDMYTLQKLLTNKSHVMTQRYAHLRDEALRKASNLAGDIISQAINGNQQKVISLKEKRG